MDGKSQGRNAGYTYLCDLFEICSIPNWHSSEISSLSAHKTSISGGAVHQLFRSEYWPGDSVGVHLEFALKYDGVNLLLLYEIFQKAPVESIVEYISSRPTGKYARRIWFFFEFLTGRRLPVGDVKTGNYVNALEPDKYYVLAEGEHSKRHRVVNNLPGTADFCPLVRRTQKLAEYESLNIRSKCEAITASYDSSILQRALGYLYSKETKSSFAIEQVKISAKRSARFMSALAMAEKTDFCNRDSLIELQNLIVDPRFQEKNYRSSQNYIGQTVSFRNEIIHYICPKPEDLCSLMEGFVAAHKLMNQGDVSPVVHCAVVAYGFVFLHPFEDGNGRIHRFLIHNILSKRDVVPSGLMFPVSAVMLKNRAQYDASLEVFSNELLQVIDYELDDVGQMTVDQETSPYYRFIDMTAQAEAMFSFIMRTVDDELEDELSFLLNYDATKRVIQEIIDMPDKLIDLFIKLSLQNNGRLSKGKRKTHFGFLTDEEFRQLTAAIDV